MKHACILLGLGSHLGSIVFVFWIAGWWPAGTVFLVLNCGAGFFYAVSERVK